MKEELRSVSDLQKEMGMERTKETMGTQNSKSCDQEIPISVAICERTLSQSAIQSGQSIQHGLISTENRVPPAPVGQPTVSDRL
jgi:hypothetical protein